MYVFKLMYMYKQCCILKKLLQVKVPTARKPKKKASATSSATATSASSTTSPPAITPPSCTSLSPPAADVIKKQQIPDEPPPYDSLVPTSDTKPVVPPKPACRFQGANPPRTSSFPDSDNVASLFDLEDLIGADRSRQQQQQVVGAQQTVTQPQSQLPTALPDCRHASHPLSSPTSGYNTMGSSPSGAGSSPYSFSGYSPQSGTSASAGSGIGYPNSCGSPNDVFHPVSAQSPPVQQQHAMMARASHPLPPAHLQAITQQRNSRLQQQQLAATPLDPTMYPNQLPAYPVPPHYPTPHTQGTMQPEHFAAATAQSNLAATRMQSAYPTPSPDSPSLWSGSPEGAYF